MENVKVTLVKSTVGCKANQIATAKTLGLTKPGKSIVLPDDAVLQGKIKVISHLVKAKHRQKAVGVTNYESREK